MRKNIILTAVPRTGKSTLLKKIISNIDNKIGFVTNEILENNERSGFEIKTYDDYKFILASTKFKTEYQVSRYFVDVKNLDNAIERVTNFKSTDLLYLDEIAQMEMYSDKFKDLTLKYLNSENTCIMTMSKVYTDGFMENIKNRDDIILLELTQNNRDNLDQFVTTLFKKISKAKRYVSDKSRFNIYGPNNTIAQIKTDSGVRNLIFAQNQNSEKMTSEKSWACDCKFYDNYDICSHVIALEEYIKNK